jgi:hypothetical protein
MRSPKAGAALIMAHQTGLFCVPQLADIECPKTVAGDNK